jgi:geranylgeranyl reductase family protein
MITAQPSTADLHDREWDVVIVGAGPAGATAAAHLARAGHQVLLLDRHRFPRDKVCGDALIPDAIAALGRLGLLEAVRESGCPLGLTSVFSPSRIEFEVPGTFITLKRLHFDEILARRAASMGATLAQATVERIDTPADAAAVVVRGCGKPIQARLAIVATGANAAVVPTTVKPEVAGPSAVALRCYVRSAVEIDRLIISYDHAVLPGYAWIFPLGRGEYNVGCGMLLRANKGRGPAADASSNLRHIFQRFTEQFPLAHDLMAAARDSTPLKGATLRCGLSGADPVPAPHVLAIGESIGTTFPFTGEGIGKAMETGEIAAAVASAALRTGDLAALAEFAGRLAELQPKYQGYRIAEKWLSWPWVVDLLARRARRSRYLRDALAGILDETVDPRAVFSAPGIARWLVG